MTDHSEDRSPGKAGGRTRESFRRAAQFPGCAFALPGLRLCCLIALFLLPPPLAAQEAYLVTYGPGQDVWERFGHNAIWIRDPAAGTDHTYSFGYFEIDRPGFHRDFARGIMLYYGARSESLREFEFYYERDRGITLQRLNLSAERVAGLMQSLEAAIFPAPQYYQYDYYFNNCSTYLRDFLDTAFDGQISVQLKALPAGQNFRDHTRRLTAQKFWLHTGMMLGLGRMVDEPRSAWEEAFLPQALHDWLQELEVDGAPVIRASEFVHETLRFYPPATAPGLWPRYLLLGVITALLIALPAWRGGSVWRLLPLRLWLVANAVAGLLLIYLWAGTAHEASARNMMVLLLNPAWAGLLFFRNKWLWASLAFLTLAGLTLMIWPAGPQFRLDQLAWLVPANLAALIVLKKASVEFRVGFQVVENHSSGT